MLSGPTQSQTGVQGALGLLCSGGRAFTAWAGLVSFFFFFFLRVHYLTFQFQFKLKKNKKNNIAKISREHYVSSWDANIVIAIKIRYIVQPYLPLCIVGTM